MKMEKFNFSIETVANLREGTCAICQKDLIIRSPLWVFHKESKSVCRNCAEREAPELEEFLNNFYSEFKSQWPESKFISRRYADVQRPTECFRCKDLFSSKGLFRCTDGLGRPLCFICLNKIFPNECCRTFSHYIWEGFGCV